ncbi:glycosyl hydrolase family 18 protein [Halorhabdus sp. BNX81]|uniref:glycosyl hydrolase family 18 protein n=1 Tax=Halorhabdus sp. BNX81 TaxID=2980181 RepID=UPI0023DCFD67|nr:glycosyl hydrolase family 18 protein [Halorhabdus sp. BNX81]
MKRRDYLRSLSALAGLAGVSVASAEGNPSEWEPETTYSGGDRVVHNGNIWEAQWWTRGREPAENAAVWERIESVDGSDGTGDDGDGADDSGDTGEGDSEYPSWEASRTYTSGDRVTHAGYVWEAEWWTRGDEPGADEWGPWTEIRAVQAGDGEDGGSSELEAVVDVSTQFPDVGEEVTLDGSESTGNVDSSEWEIEGVGTASGVEHTLSFSQGQHEVTLTVSDGAGNADTDSITITAGRPSTDEQRVVAYYRQWAQFDRNYLPADIDFDRVTHLQYAFARPESDGSVTLVGDSYARNVFSAEKDWQQPDRGKSFAGYAAERDDVSFVLSIGGWGDSEHFSDAALDQGSREQFASDCVDLVENNDIDGVDVDWEFPGGGGEEGNTVRAGDQERFTLLMEEVRDQLDAAAEANPDRSEPYELTAAMSPAPETVRGLEHGRLSDLLDFVNVMTFDYRGIFSETTGHHAPLKANPNDPLETGPEWNASYALSFYEQQGWEPAQLNMAVPFYGRSWTDVQPPEGDFGNGVDDGLFQQYLGDGADASGDGSYPRGTDVSGVWEYFDLGGDGRETSDGRIGSNPIDLDSAAWETYFDDQAVCSYSYNPSEGMMISHPTERSIEAKMQWLASSPYGGTMLWAIGGDTKEGTLITTLWDTLNG